MGWKDTIKEVPEEKSWKDTIVDAPIQEESTPIELINNTTLPALTGAAIGQTLKGTANVLQPALENLAENTAFQVSGLPQTRSGQQMMEMLPEEQRGVTKKQISRKILDEGLLPGISEKSREKDLRKVIKEGKDRAKVVANYLENIDATVPAEELISRLEQTAMEEIPESERFTKESARKINEIKSEQKRLQKLLEAGKTEYTLKELE
jgi:hypothetical protein